MEASNIVSMLPRPRKTPRQGRSRAKVSYMIEAARQILYEEGADAVTTRRVSERSGVAIGSLYQYFPNRDAILARLAEEEVRRQSKAMQEFYASMRKLPLPELLTRTVQRLIENERHMLAFGGDFYRRYSQHYQVAQRVGRDQFGEILDADTQTVDTVRILKWHLDDIRAPDIELTAYLLARGIPSLVGNLVADMPELIDSPQLHEALTRVALAMADCRV